MKSSNELKEIDIKNRVCYYFDDTINGTNLISVILIKSVVNKNKNNYYNIFLEKSLYKDKWMFVYYKCYKLWWNDVSEGLDVNKTSASKECDISHYLHFLNDTFFS